MDNFKVNFLNQNIEFCIDKVKLLLGSNVKRKFEVIQALRSHFNKTNQTEFNSRYDRKSLFVNDKIADIRHWEFIEISTFFDLNTDMKLASKSLLLKYFESILKDIEYSETFSTLNLVLKNLEEEWLSDLEFFNAEELIIQASLQEFTLKSLLKHLQPIMLKEELESNVYDLSYEEIISLQIKIVESIAKNNPDRSYICAVNIAEINDNFYNILKSNDNNIYFLILSEMKCRITENHQDLMKEVVIFEENTIDLINEEHLYNNILLDLPYHTDIEELQSQLLNYCLGIEDKTDILINKI